MDNVSNLSDVYNQYCLKLIGNALHSLQGHDANIVRDESLYRQKVIEPCWKYLPLPLRMYGRDQLRWDEYFLALRLEAFRAFDGKLAVRQDIDTRMQNLVKRLFGNTPSQVGATSVPSAQPSGDVQVAVGIDLGTTYSAIAHIDAHGRPTTILNAAGDLTTPSVVLFDSEGPIVGKEAFMAAGMEPEKVAVLAKRDMGNAVYRRKVNNENLPPEVICSIILRSLKGDAERKLGTIKKAVVTVPAYFDEARRRATMDAGRLAGMDILDIINEPTAAAIAFGYQVGFLESGGQPEHQAMRVLVYDLGGGTFDVTILEVKGTEFKTIATDGDVTLGGADWDEKLLDLAAERFRAAHREDPRDNPNSFMDLWFACETAKKTLSERSKASIYISHLGMRMKVDITREEFEEATSALLGRTRTTTEIVLRQAGLNWAGIDRVLLVGGSTRMPMVGRMLQEVTGKQPERSVSPDEAVAHGAALYANLLLQKQTQQSKPAAFSITNVNSHSLGIVGVDPATGRRKNQILIPKNTPLPHSVTRTFKTQKPNQPSVVIRVVEGESERPEACSQVGVATITDLPANLPAGSPVMVNYAYGANGQLTVTGQVKGMSKPARAVFQRENSMKENDLRMWGQFVGRTQNE